MAHKLLFRLPGSAALRWVIGRVMGKAVLSVLVVPFVVPTVAPTVALLVTIGFTSPSLAEKPVFSNDSMLWEGPAAGDAAAAAQGVANQLDQDRAVLALDAARNLDEHSQLILAEPDADEVARRMAPGNSPAKDAYRQAQQTGFTRELQGFAQLAPSPAGTRRSSDGQDYVVSQRLVGSAGAVSIRLHFSDVHLPAGARLYVYGSMYMGRADDDERHNTQPRGYDSAWLGDRTSFWSHTVAGDSAVVEYHAPLERGTTGRAASYTVDQVVHNVVDTFGHHDGATSADVASCHLDMCNNPAWQEVGNAVMRIGFVNRGRANACSGALLNDRANSGTPYIYTANHCISTQSVASTVELGYFYQRNRCSDDPDSKTVTHLGSTLLATGGELLVRIADGEPLGDGSDFTLLRASTAPPDGIVLLGWTTADIALGTPVTGIHHPGGSFKRISFGSKTGNFPNSHRIDWSSGLTEGGSSGSPLVINGPGTSVQVIGTVSSGLPRQSCSNPSYTGYGKFAEAWPSFHRYLDPDSSGVPDVLVDNVSVSDASVETGVSFTINATVRNSGNGAAAATTLRYYRSTNSTITTADSELTTDEVGRLAANGTSQESAEVSIADLGSYWVGACVDPVSGETSIDNNCSNGVEVSVTAPPGVVPTLPDLTVTNTSVSDATPEAGADFTINATARNSGNGASAATTLRYYRSTNNTITTDDSELTTDTVGGLAPGATSQENATVSIADAGNYWVGACVDPVVGEVARTNNCSTAVQVSVTAPPGVLPTLPDLTVGGVSVAESSVEASAVFTINATVRNQGTAASVATTLHYYSSDDSTITASDTQLATKSVEALLAGASSQQSAEVVIADAGSYWVGACVAEVNNESTTDNNCSSGVPVIVTARPDNNNGILQAIIQLLLLP